VLEKERKDKSTIPPFSIAKEIELQGGSQLPARDAAEGACQYTDIICKVVGSLAGAIPASPGLREFKTPRANSRTALAADKIYTICRRKLEKEFQEYARSH
jgi:hypothetical protein